MVNMATGSSNRSGPDESVARQLPAGGSGNQREPLQIVILRGWAGRNMCSHAIDRLQRGARVHWCSPSRAALERTRQGKAAYGEARGAGRHDAAAPGGPAERHQDGRRADQARRRREGHHAIRRHARSVLPHSMATPRCCEGCSTPVPIPTPRRQAVRPHS